MIAYIKGQAVSIGKDSIVVENNGIGYHIRFTQQHNISLNDQVTIYTFLNVREDELTLFGFKSTEDLDLFVRLISVKGIGPRIALNMFAGSDSTRIIQAIEEGNVDYLRTLPGIGAKTASQMVLDLKGKLVEVNTNKGGLKDEVREALSGLKNLGYKQSELNSIEKELSAQAKDKSVSDLIKLGLQLLLKRKGG